MSLPPAPQAPQLNEEEQKLVSKLREWLQSTKYNSPGGEYAKHVRAYIPGTGAWVRKSPEFRSWHGALETDQQQTGCLWVHGVPGSGKSVLAASIVQHLESVEPESPVLFFFFRQIVQRNHDPKYLVRDFAAQLLPYSANLRHELNELSQSSGSVDGIEMRQVWDILERAIGAMDKVYCVADALDEMDNEHFEFITKLRQLGLSDPRKVKVVLTSRPVPSIVNVLRDPGIVEVKLQPSMIYPDIVKYVNVRLGSLIPRLSADKEQLVRDTICQRAQGLFLHARLITDTLTENLKLDIVTEETLPDSMERTPASLKEFYEHMLVEHATRSGVDREHQVRILSCVINASRPMRVIELGSLIAHMRGEPDNLKKGKTLVTEGCGRLLEVLEDETVSVIHHSFTEFLRDETRNRRGAFPVLDSARAHGEMAVALLEYLDSIPFQPTAVSCRRGSITGSEITEDSGPEIIQDDEPKILEDGEPEIIQDDDDSEIMEDESGITKDGKSDSGYSDYSGAIDHNIEPTNDKVKDLHLENPLMRYALDNWVYHVKNAEHADPLVLKALHKFLRQGGPAFELSTHDARGSRASYDPEFAPIHLASQFGLVAYAEQLISADPTLVETKDGSGGTPLAVAAEHGQTEVAKLLLEHGAEPDLPDKFGLKPMHHCATQGDAGVAKLLLEKGASPRTKTTKYSKNHMYYYGERNDGKTALQFACQHYDKPDVLIAFVPYLTPEDAPECLNWVHDAERLEAILKIGVLDIDRFSDKGKTALFRFAERHNDKCVEILVKYGADPNKRCSPEEYRTDEGEKDENGNVHFPNGPTPIHAFSGCCHTISLHWSTLEPSRQCLQHLLDAGGDINATCHTNRYEFGKDDDLTALHFAVMKGDSFMWGSSATSAALLSELLVENGANVNALSKNSETPAHYATTEYAGVFELLGKHGADLNKKNDEGLTPLLQRTHPSRKEHFPTDTLDAMLSAGADVNAVSKIGSSVIHFLMASAGEGGWHCRGEKGLNLPLFKGLVAAGADLNRKNDRGIPPLHLYDAKYDLDKDEPVLRELVNDGLDVNARDSEGKCMLAKILDQYCSHIVGEHDPKLHVAAMFVRLGAKADAVDNHGESLLHKVLRKDDPLPWIRFFVAEGADYMLESPDGNTLVQLAIKHVAKDQANEVIDYLVKLGVPNSDKNNKGQTRLHLASAESDYTGNWDRHTMIAILEEYKAALKPVDEADNLGATPLHYAASVDTINVGRLLRAGADPTLLTNEGVSPLHIAAVARQPNTVGILLSEYEKRGKIKTMIDLQSNDALKRTALHFACRSGRPESVRYLIAHGANVHAVDAKGLTPLHAALEFPEESRLWESGDTVSYLVQVTELSRFGQRNEGARNGRGPERIADIVSMLAEAGCDLNAEVDIDEIPMTPLDIAIKDGFREMAIVLDELGASSYGANLDVKLFNDAERETEVQLLMDLSNGKEIVDERYTGPRRILKNLPEEVFKLLRQGRYGAIRDFAQKGGNSWALDESNDCTAAHVLATGGYSDLIRLFKEQAVSLSSQDWMKEKDNPGTLLGAVCRSEMPNLPMIKLLVEEFGLDVNERSNPRGYIYKLGNATPLHSLACGLHWWNVEAVEYLLQQGADIEAKNAYGHTPLLAAISSDYPSGFWKVETVKVLLKHGANVEVSGFFSQSDTCLRIANDVAITKLLLQYGADAKSPLHMGSLSHAVELLQEEMAQVLIGAGQDVNVAAGEASVEVGIRRKLYPLHEAARRDDRTDLPSDTAAKRASMTRLLLSEGADPFCTYKNGETILQLVIENHGVVQPFLELEGLDVHRRGSKGRTLLISACVPTSFEPDSYATDSKPPSFANFEAILGLLKLGAAVDAVDDEGRTALHWLVTMAAEFDEKRKTAFNALLEADSSLINARDNKGFKPIHLALKSRQTWVVQRLIEAGADIKEADPLGNNALHCYAPGLVGEKNSAADTAEDFKWLFTHDMDINARNTAGETPLFAFISAGWKDTGLLKEDSAFHAEYLGLFTDAGADIKTANNNGTTLLHVVAGTRFRRYSYLEEDNVDTFKKLLELGADPRAEDDKMRSAIDCAVAREKMGITQLFKGEGKKVSLDDEEEEEKEDSDEESEPGYEMVESVKLGA
ncbi:ankyrin repeat-containing [Fusarium albosuccineum]|uniref:Ankyrin repeat-containing n=1 Tax=Fusarium albosuccineum TaxID=1237068 RepID=A0A8H4PCC9_9HYPO|nr:ankyrin repeat-containing [Fusarium albosuccineum]